LNPAPLNATILRMSDARVVGIAILALASILRAQSPAGTRVTITVMDQTGAYVPGATVTVQSDSALPLDPVQTDSRGQAELVLPTVPCTIKVTAPGFKNWWQQIKAPDEIEQKIKS
jgi:hypothetical protein